MALLVAVLTASPLRAADDPQWEWARAAIADLDYRNVLKRYEPLRVEAAEGSPEWTEATFCVALAHQHTQPLSKPAIDEATRLYEQVASKSKDDRYVARAIMNIGRILELRDFKGDVIDLPGAHDKYRQVLDRFPDAPTAGEAALRAGAALVSAYDAPSFTSVRQGVAEIEAYLAARPNDPYASMMWQYVADTYFIPLGDAANAVRCYEQVDKLGWTDKGNQGPSYWRISQLAERELKQPDLAAKYYAKIITETPNSGKAYEAMVALQRLGRPVPQTMLFKNVPTTLPTEGKR
jgi:tetratricopeptide (TPR) repeat protein